jgi:Fe2+/Zn2+ uptake regulation proteins
MNKEIENKLIHKNTKPTSMRILVYDFLSSQQVATSLSEIENHFENADRTTIYRTLKTFEEKESSTAFRKIRPQNTNYATTIAMKKRTKTGISISTAKSASKLPAKKTSRSQKV